LVINGKTGIVKNACLYGACEAIAASRYPMQVDIDEKALDADSVWFALQTGTSDTLQEGARAIQRAEKLGRMPSHTGEDNYLCGITVQFDLTFSKQAWAEAERYHWFQIVSSQSTMHRLANMSMNDACTEYVDDRIMAVMNELQCRFNEDHSRENYLRMIYSCPSGLRLTARITTNFRQLKTILEQRQHHRLPEWREFCEWIQTIPYFKRLCMEENRNDIR